MECSSIPVFEWNITLPYLTGTDGINKLGMEFFRLTTLKFERPVGTI